MKMALLISFCARVTSLAKMDIESGPRLCQKKYLRGNRRLRTAQFDRKRNLKVAATINPRPFGQPRPVEQLGRAHRESKASYSGRHSYDVVEYKLFMDWCDVLTGLSNRYDGVMQVKFHPGFTGPISSITQVVCTTPKASRVRFDIYDVLGREVKSIDEGYQEANKHRIELDDGVLASGVHICRMKTDVADRTIKLRLMK